MRYNQRAQVILAYLWVINNLAQAEIAEVATREESSAMTAGEIILDDLVNQFLEKNKESVKRETVERDIKSSDSDSSIDREPDLSTNKLPNHIDVPNQNHAYRQESSRETKSLNEHKIKSPEAKEPMTTTTLRLSSSLPYMHLLAMSTSRPTDIEATASMENDEVQYGDSYLEDGERLSAMINAQDDDRHIQYDVVHNNHVAPPVNQLFNGSTDKLGEMHALNETDLNQKNDTGASHLEDISSQREKLTEFNETNSTQDQIFASNSTRLKIQAKSMGSSGESSVKSRAPYASSYSNHQLIQRSPVHESQLVARLDNPALGSESSALTNSMNKISSHLVATNELTSGPLNDPSMFASAQGTPSGFHQNVKKSTNAPKSPDTANDLGLNQVDANNRNFHNKLATSINQLVELDPIPYVNKGVGNPLELHQDDNTKTIQANLAARTRDKNNLLSFNPDRTKKNPASNLQELATNDFMTDYQSTNRNNSGSFTSDVNMQAQNLGSNGFLHRGGHYAASLINVTAPMTPPLSASEAMESSPDSHETTGFPNQHNPNVSTQRPRNSAIQTTTPGPQMNPEHYFTQQLFDTQARVYSQPANQYSPQNSKLNSHLNGINSSPVNLDPLSGDFKTGAEPSNSTDGRERTRYDGHHHTYLVPRTPNAQEHNNNFNHHSQASGFRSPISSGSQISSSSNGAGSNGHGNSELMLASPSQASVTNLGQQTSSTSSIAHQNQMRPTASTGASNSPTNGFTTSVSTIPLSENNSNQQNGASTTPATTQIGSSSNPNPPGKRVFNLTRVEHISAECSDDLIRTVIMFNGTFKGIIYSSGYVRDPNCLYINGTGKNRYDFSIRLNQCGTLGRQELHPPSGPNEVRRRDQVMWNTLSIQYNPIIEQEWDEHFRVSCEYGSDFWKTVSFSPMNVETNTGSPVAFTVEPPKCQMEILKGHGMVGPRQDAIPGPVIVGDPLTLLIHMKSEKAGYDILVKNCVAHNGGSQKMQLIDSNGCVVNERFISPFRGTYNDNDPKHVTLYSYLKAFRFTGKPVLYLECEVHMCQTACPPQMCYWRRLSKRSTNETSDESAEEFINDSMTDEDATSLTSIPFEDIQIHQSRNEDPSTTNSPRRPRRFNFDETNTNSSGLTKGRRRQESDIKNKESQNKDIFDSMNLVQTLEVFEDRDFESDAEFASKLKGSSGSGKIGDDRDSLVCYQRAEIFAFLFTVGAALLAALSITIGCCWRAASLASSRRLHDRRKLHYMNAII